MGFAAAMAEAGYKNAERQEVAQFLSTGYPPLDKAISGRYRNGGLPVGRIVEIFGPPSSGKTAIATAAMASAQKLGGVAIFKDHENSFDVSQGESLGLSDSPDCWSYSKPDTFEKSIQDAINQMLLARNMTIKDGEIISVGDPHVPWEAPIVVVFDSLASMVPQSTLKDASARNMNDNTALARATSAHFPTLAKLAERTNTLMIFLNQARTKIGVMYGDPTTTPGGAAPEFYSSVRMKLGREILSDKTTKEKRGQRIVCETIKNKVNRPFIKVSWDFNFQDDGSGKFDVIGGVVDDLVTLGKIERSGAWTTWDGKKWNSRPELIKHIEDNGQFTDLMDLYPEDE